MDITATSTYGNPEAYTKILNEYEIVSGKKVEQMDYFIVFAAARRLFSIFVSIKMGPSKLGMRPGAENIIKRNVKHIKAVYDLLYEKTNITIPEIEKMISDIS